MPAAPRPDYPATLIALSGLPGVGKTTLSRALAAQIGAIHLRVDSIEAALKRSTLKIHPADDAGYVVLAALAEDNLRLGFCVIADTVNPAPITRDMWTACAARAEVPLLNVEVRCSDPKEHRHRVETRQSDISGMVLPDWEKVQRRDYLPWAEDCLALDTATRSPTDCAARIAEKLKDLSGK